LINLNNLFSDLLANIEADGYRGWDPYDGLNSNFIQILPIKNNHLIRLTWIQSLKRLPVNFRTALQIDKGYNIKGLSLILSALILLQKKSYAEYSKQIDEVLNIIIKYRSASRDYYCWGYNFPWEARAFSVPRWQPNMIVSTFVAQSLLDLYKYNNNDQYLNYAKDVGEFIINELLLYKGKDEICFGYIPEEKTIVHNANLMGAKLFARLYSITNLDQYKEYAINSTNYTINRQRHDGAWLYGLNKHHKWVDNFHTGFNLVALYEIQSLTKKDYSINLKKGIDYHLSKHFLEDMTPKYYDTSLYPIDIHNFAQGVDTLLTFGYYNKAKALLILSIDNMWDMRRKYFYYQKTKYWTNKIDYFRWSQAWMLFALAKYITCDLLKDST